jgi:hypothetical protein
MFFVAISIAAQKTHGLSFRLGNSELIQNPEADVYADFSKAKICGVGKKSHPFPNMDQCVIGENQENFEVALFGDSHAGHFSSAVINVAQKHQLSIGVFYLFSCPIWLNETGVEAKDKCAEYRQRVWKILQEKTHIKYVVLASSWDGSVESDDASKKLFKENLVQTIERVISLNKKLIILGRVPSFEGGEQKNISPLKCIEKNLVPLQRIIPMLNKNCTQLPLSFFEKQMQFNDLMKKVAAQYKNRNVLFLDSFPYFCDDQSCSAVQNNILLYSDKGHLNKEGAKYIEESGFLKPAF